MPDAAPITLLALDVDGVLTDGSIYIDDNGHETKRFNVRDGFGIKLWQQLGFKVAIITGRSGQALRHRMAELAISEFIQGSANKSTSLDELCAKLGHSPQAVAYLGDDWPDLCILRRVGYPMAVADADPLVKAAAAWTTRAPGGHGAVREAVEHLIEQKGLMDRARALYDPGNAPPPRPQ
jgi:3-deoxy-D-manno-octulosonate 8-phosphate phosphatase (KDO 8-P phosphatase)